MVSDGWTSENQVLDFHICSMKCFLHSSAKDRALHRQSAPPTPPPLHKPTSCQFPSLQSWTCYRYVFCHTNPRLRYSRLTCPTVGRTQTGRGLFFFKSFPSSITPPSDLISYLSHGEAHSWSVLNYPGSFHFLCSLHFCVPHLHLPPHTSSSSFFNFAWELNVWSVRWRGVDWSG